MSQQQHQDINLIVLPKLMEKLSMSQTQVRRMSQITGCDINCVKRLVENPLRRFKILLQEQDNRQQTTVIFS